MKKKIYITGLGAALVLTASYYSQLDRGAWGMYNIKQNTISIVDDLLYKDEKHVVVHEACHAIYFDMLNLEEKEFWRKNYKTEWSVSEYGKKNVFEYFAEWCAYKQKGSVPDSLKTTPPYMWLEDNMKDLDIVVKPLKSGQDF